MDHPTSPGANRWESAGLTRAHFFPPRTVELRGRRYSIPRKAEWILDQHYGDWHTVRKCAHAATGAAFGVEDYAVPAPPWALFGAAEDGFDPVDTRVYKKKANGKSR